MAAARARSERTQRSRRNALHDFCNPIAVSVTWFAVPPDLRQKLLGQRRRRHAPHRRGLAARLGCGVNLAASRKYKLCVWNHFAERLLSLRSPKRGGMETN